MSKENCSNNIHDNSANTVVETKVEKYGKVFYYLRKLYFEAKVDNKDRIVHTYNSTEMARMATRTFHVKVSPNTIRTWINSKDRDLDNRTWRMEWNRICAEGILNAGENHRITQHPFQNPQVIEKEELTGQQRLTFLKQKSIENDAEIAVSGDAFTKLLIREMKEEYERTGTLNRDDLKTLGAFHTQAKARMLNELRDLDALEAQVDKEQKYGRFVKLKEPASRERVRNVLIGMLNAVDTEENLKKYTAEEEAEEVDLEEDID